MGSRERRKLLIIENDPALRKELSEMLGARVHLFLHVKVDENWAESREIYEEMGLDWVR